MVGDPNYFKGDGVLAELRVHVQRLRATLRRRLGFSQAEGRDADFEQAVVRVTLASAVLGYAIYVVFDEGTLTRGMTLAIFATSMVLVAGLWMMWQFKLSPVRPTSMRYFGICADLIPMTIGLFGAGEAGVPVIGIYLWITVGNGFRFGPRFLLFSYWLSALCFTGLLIFAPFWQQHRAIGIGLGILLAAIPLYVLVLLSRLTAQKDKALELSNAKSRFVANVSHELRTPLTGVFAVYDLLRRRRLATDERQLVGSLGNAITTLKASVDAVLQMSKLEAGAERAEMRLFNLRYFLQQLSMLVRPQAAAKQLAWRLDVGSEVSGTVVGDPAHLQHILGNLLNNAFKFTPKGGVTLRVSRGETGVRFEVVDTGIGIPLDQQESLFERFVQADASATRRFGGTGLGTSIAHDLVKLMGGTIGVYSAPGHGATFWVELPLGEPPLEVAVPDWGDRNEVLLIGPEGHERDELITTLVACGVKPVPCTPTLDNPPSFAADQYLGAVLILPAAEASAYADAVLRESAGAVCPWLVVTRTCTPTQAAVLLKSGASGLLPPNLEYGDWQRHLAGLINRIHLPTADSEQPTTAVATRALRILLADDNPSNQMLLARILGDAGHEVTVAVSGGEAYDVMAAGTVELALLDFNMPEMSGSDATKLFRAGEIGGKGPLPIIILSADATAAAREDSLAAGANEYITKPVTSEALLATIERVVAAMQPRPVVASAATVVHPPRPIPVVPPSAALPAPTARPIARPTAASILVDPDRIDALRRIAHNDRNFLKKYVDAVFVDVEVALVELRSAVDKGNSRGARDALHKIDGTGASIGAVALMATAKEMRNYVSGAMDSDAASALADLATSCAMTKSVLTAMLHETQTPDHPR